MLTSQKKKFDIKCTLQNDKKVDSLEIWDIYLHFLVLLHFLLFSIFQLKINSDKLLFKLKPFLRLLSNFYSITRLFGPKRRRNYFLSLRVYKCENNNFYQGPKKISDKRKKSSFLNRKKFVNWKHFQIERKKERKTFQLLNKN